MDPSKSTHIMILSLDMIVLGKFSLGSYVPGSKNMKYVLHLDLESASSLTFERFAGGGTHSIQPSVQSSTVQQVPQDQTDLSTNAGGDNLTTRWPKLYMYCTLPSLFPAFSFQRGSEAIYLI